MSDLEIWLVNDDPAQLLVQKRLLGRFAATVWDFQSPTELLAQAKRFGSCPNLVSDFNMPGMNGFQLSQIWCEMHPDARVLLLSASHLSATDRENLTFLPRNHVKVLTSFRLPELIQEARDWFSPDARKDSELKHPESDPTSGEELAQFDAAVLTKLRTLGGVEFLQKALKRFADRIPSRLEVFERALAEGDHKALCSEAHSLKGSCGIVGAQSMLELSDRMEELASQQAELGELRSLVQELALAWESTQAELNGILKKA